MSDHVITISTAFSNARLDTALQTFTEVLRAEHVNARTPTSVIEELALHSSMLHQAFTAQRRDDCTTLLAHISAIALAAAVECAK